MGVVIHDDIYEACEQIKTEKQRGEFIMAVVRYGFSGIEPKGSPSWLPIFTVLKKRIKLGSTRANSGSKGGKITKQNAEANNGNQASKTQANGDFACEENDKQNGNLLSRVEDGVEVEVEFEFKDPPNPPFGLLCLKAVNDTLGTAYGQLPPKVANFLPSMADKYTIEDVGDMLAYKRDEWRGTRFAKNLTPNTLLGAEHFEQYIYQSRSSADEKSKYAIYD